MGQSETMSSALNPRLYSRPIKSHRRLDVFAGTLAPRRQLRLRLPHCTFSSISLQPKNVSSEPSLSSSPPPPPSSSSSAFISSIGSSPSPLQVSYWNSTHRHILLLNVIACAVPSLSVHYLCYLLNFLFCTFDC